MLGFNGHRVVVSRLLFSILTILSFCPHPSILPFRHFGPLAPLERLLSVHFQTPWRSGCSLSSISCVGSETRFWSGALLNKAHLRFRCVCAWSGSDWSETPSPAQVFGNESIFDVLCVCLSRIPLLFRYKVKTLISIICKAKSHLIFKRHSSACSLIILIGLLSICSTSLLQSEFESKPTKKNKHVLNCDLFLKWHLYFYDLKIMKPS